MFDGTGPYWDLFSQGGFGEPWNGWKSGPNNDGSIISTTDYDVPMPIRTDAAIIPVRIDATGTKLSSGVAVTTFDYTGLTVTAGASTLVAFLNLEILAGGFSGLTMVWDPGGANQSLSQIIGAATTTNSARAELWGLVSPVAGNKILRVTWVTAHKYAFDAISLTGADLTGGVVTFANANSATGSGTTTSVTITSSVDNMVVATHAADVSCSATNNTTIYTDSSGVAGAANRAAGAPSVAMTATIGSDDWIAIGCNIKVAPVATFIPGRDIRNVELAVAAWQPEAWPYSFHGGRAPYEAANLNPALEAVSEDFPPPMVRQPILLPQDPALPTQVRYAIKEAAQSVDNPPIPAPENLNIIYGTWQPPDPQPTQKRPSQIVSVDNPPIPVPENLNVVYTTWLPPDPQPTQKAPTQIVSVDNPPFTGRTHNPIIVRAWQPPDPQAPFAGKLSPGIPGQSVDNPPSVQARVHQNAILVSWRPPDAQAPFAGKLSPGIPGQSVDNPPIPVPENLNVIYGAWQPPDPLPTQKRPLQTLSVDNPPVRYRDILSELVVTWQPPDPLPTQKRPSQMVSVDDPPLPVPENLNVVAVLRSWQPPDPQPTQKAPTQIVSVDNPPTRYRDILTGIVWAWQPPDPLPTQRRPSQLISVDNPPIRYRDIIPQIMVTWQPPDPLPTQRRPSQMVSVDNPPIPVPENLNVIYTTWQPPDPLPTQRRPSQIVSVDNPPTRYRDIIPQIIVTWQPPDPLPTQKRPSQTVSVDNPPIPVPENLAVIYGTWQPPDPLPTQRRPTQTVSVDNPPIPVPENYLSSIYVTWIPPDPPPTQRTRLNPAIEAVAEDNPPFTERQQNRSTIVQMWQPEVWPYSFQGGLQPYASRRLNPAFEFEAVDNPPFSERQEVRRGIIQAWQPELWPFTYFGGSAPYDPKNVNPAFEAVREDTIIFRRQQMPYPPEPPPPLQPQRKYTLADLTVVTYTTSSWMGQVLRTWQPEPPPIERRVRTIVSVDDPPKHDGSFTLTAVLRSWQQPDPQPQQRRFLAIQAEVPVFARNFHALIISWQAPETAVQARRLPSGAVPGFSVDQPPAPRQQPQYVPEPYPAPQQARRVYAEQPILVLPVRNWVSPVLKAWVLEQLPIQRSPSYPQEYIAPVVSDLIVRYNTWVWGVLSSWQPPDPLPYHRYILNPLLLKPLKGFRIELRGNLAPRLGLTGSLDTRVALEGDLIRGPILEGDMIFGPTLSGTLKMGTKLDLSLDEDGSAELREDGGLEERE